MSATLTTHRLRANMTTDDGEEQRVSRRAVPLFLDVDVQELVGHQSLAMTQRYSQLSPAALDATIGLLENRATSRAVGDRLETPKG